MTAALQLIALALVCGAGLGVVLTRDPLRQAISAGFFGLCQVLVFVLYQAPDVALSALVVNAFAIPALVLLALAKVAEWRAHHELEASREESS